MAKKPNPFKSQRRDLVTSRRRACLRRSVADGAARVQPSLEVSPTWLWEFNIVTGRVQTSELAEEVCGRARQSVRSSFAEFVERIVPEDRSGVIAAFGEAMESRGIFGIEYRHIRQNGDVQWISCKGRVIYDRSGLPLRIIGLQTDVTRQKEVEDQLRRSRDQFVRLFQERADELLHVTQQLESKNAECLRLQRAIRQLSERVPETRDRATDPQAA